MAKGVSVNKRNLLKAASAFAIVGGAAGIGKAATTPDYADIALGPFKPSWESLSANYKTPDWFRDAKFGIWAHWSAQCVPEQGDWYGRKMYLQGDPAYEYHLNTYGHPSKVGLMELQNLWQAERWEPEKLMALYKRAGAKYFVSLANHHDNFDAYDSTYHMWNSVKVGPRKDIVGIWAKVARKHGLRYGVSNHSSWAPRWLQPAYGYDGDGPMAGVRYDAATLTKADGQGKWWEGLDPQDLYTGPSVVMPAGLTSAEAVRQWQTKNTSLARSNPLPAPKFVENWYRRCKDLVDKYKPDLLYFDTNELPLEQAGLDIAAHYYNTSASRNKGYADVVINGKHIRPEHAGSFVEDIERGVAKGIRSDAWQTDTCIGQWHYDRATAEAGGYKSVAQVVRMLIDIVSKNGNLLLSIPLRGDGTIDAHEEDFLEGMAQWMQINGESLYGTRPWRVFGEGPTAENPQPVKPGAAKEAPIPYTGSDIRFTTKAGALYALTLNRPETPIVTVKSLATNGPNAHSKVGRVALLGVKAPLEFTRDDKGLHISLPANLGHDIAVAFKITGKALV